VPVRGEVVVRSSRGAARLIGWWISVDNAKYRVRVRGYVGGFVASDCRGGRGWQGDR
jgi:hypothetical protein